MCGNATKRIQLVFMALNHQIGPVKSTFRRSSLHRSKAGISTQYPGLAAYSRIILIAFICLTTNIAWSADEKSDLKIKLPTLELPKTGLPIHLDVSAYHISAEKLATIGRIKLPEDSTPRPIQWLDAKAGIGVFWMMPGDSGKLADLLPAPNEDAVEASKSKTPIEVEVTSSKPGCAEVHLGTELLTQYISDESNKPYLWPVLGPGGLPLTRDYPMKTDTPGEENDHIHHRSWWFTHGNVNGHNFWAADAKASKTISGENIATMSGPVFGSFTASVKWVSPTGETVCTDRRTFRFSGTDDVRIADVDIVVSAVDRDVVFADDKEGTFGFRVAGTMSVDQKSKKPGGTIVNSAGQRNQKTWGQPAAWVDYHGPVGRSEPKSIAGIAMLDHPQNLRHPTTWHVRTYGLFCVNPFGLSYFKNDKKQNGSLTIKKGSEQRFRYRCIFHLGNEQEAEIAKHFAIYEKGPIKLSP